VGVVVAEVWSVVAVVVAVVAGVVVAAVVEWLRRR
jgi:hypothetical protein